jgi:hypothetical protein
VGGNKFAKDFTYTFQATNGAIIKSYPSVLKGDYNFAWFAFKLAADSTVIPGKYQLMF